MVEDRGFLKSKIYHHEIELGYDTKHASIQDNQ
jgi:hypothetical protein